MALISSSGSTGASIRWSSPMPSTRSSQSRKSVMGVGSRELGVGGALRASVVAIAWRKPTNSRLLVSRQAHVVGPATGQRRQVALECLDLSGRDDPRFATQLGGAVVELSQLLQVDGADRRGLDRVSHADDAVALQVA